MNKKILGGIVFLFLIIVVIIIIIMVYLKNNSQNTSPTINQEGNNQTTECDFKCNDNKKIPCKNNNDCNGDLCSKRGGLVSSEYGFSGYCKNGVCQKYGCGGVEPID